MSRKKIIIIVILIISIGVAFYSLYSTSGVLSPYVSFKRAIQTGTYVQIIGRINKAGSVNYSEGYFTFDLKDEDNSGMNVRYRGIKPNNFESADQVVVQGAYNSKDKLFEAERILVKCPSKYVKMKQEIR